VIRRAAILAVACTALLAAAPTAPAYPPITCGRVTLDGTTYVFRTHGPTCRYATHWLKTYIKYHHGPTGYTCRAYGTAVPAYCRGTHRRYFFANSAG
jgi:hypothetical protein